MAKKKQPVLNVEMGWSIFKCMFALLIFTNILWAGLFSFYVHKSIAEASIEMTQDGQHNNQSVVNG